MASHKETKTTWVIKSVSFVLIFTIILLILSALFLPESNSIFSNNIKESKAKGFYVQPKNSLDVVAIGNSNIESGFSPLELWNQYGVTGYTCGEPLQNIFQADNMLSEVLTCQKPKVVILDADGIFPLDGGEDTFYQLLDSKLNHLFPLLEYHNLWKAAFSGNATAISQVRLNPFRGYLFNRANVPFRGNRPKQKCSPGMNRISTAALDQFYTLCQENHAQLVLVYVPTAHSWNQGRHDWMEKYAANRSLPFIDLNTSLCDFQFNWRQDTSDGGIHLNLSGAKRVTLYLGAYLHQHYSLPDHRKDTAFKQWNEDYQSYIKAATPQTTR